MKTIIINNSALAVLLLTSSMVGAETQYPAADFQPKVVYQDPDYKPSSQPAAQAPAASASDSKYPAANFQPKVLYNDPSYQHTPPSAAETGSMQKPAAETPASESAAGEKDESSFTYFIGLIVLAVVGFVLFRKGSKGEGRESKVGSGYKVTTGSSASLTGVAKYINRASGTGVARYLEKQAKSASASSAVTGVAKYMAKKAESTKASVSESATGVEKYLRDRG
ncbi:MAG: hypothetical protein ACU84H_07830 [Gammaproteobacteria bacterium]